MEEQSSTNPLEPSDTIFDYRDRSHSLPQQQVTISPTALQPSKHEPTTDADTERQSSTLDRRRRRRHRFRKWLTYGYFTITSGLVVWSVFALVRYSIAVSNFNDDNERKHYASAFVVLSALAMVLITSHLGFSFLQLPWRWQALEQALLLLASLSILTPTLFNLAVISLWNRIPPSQTTLSLVGRCQWHFDVIWAGRSGQCDHGAPFGAWLTAAIIRFVITLISLALLHWLAWQISESNGSESSTNSRFRPRSQSTRALVTPPSPTTANKLKRKRSEPAPSSPTNSSEDQHRRTFSSSNQTHNQNTLTPLFPRSSPPPDIPPRSPARLGQHPPVSSPSPRQSGEEEVRTSTPASDVEVDDGGDLNRFAANFRSLVERVTRETEDGSRLPQPTSPTARSPTRSNTAPSSFPTRNTPSPQSFNSRPSFQLESSSSINDSQIELQRELLHAHRTMLIEQAMRAETYEHVVVLGGAVRRMSTIQSVNGDSSSDAPWTPSTAASFPQQGLTRSPSASTARTNRQQSNTNRHSPPTTNDGSGDSPVDS